MFFDDSRPDRAKRAKKLAGYDPGELLASPIPPAKSYELFTAEELLEGGDRTLILDVESYINYFLAAFKCIDSGKVIYFEDSPESSINTQWLAYVLHRFKIVTFNGRNYDIPIIQCALYGLKAETLKQVTNDIIQRQARPFEIERNYGTKPLTLNHIDLIEVAPLQASLKMYAARLGCERMQDLPYPEDLRLTAAEAANVRDYCINDLDNTELLYRELLPHIEMRERLGNEYGIDLRSKSDAQIAEAVIDTELRKLGVKTKGPNIEPGWSFRYRVPEWLTFKSEQLKDALSMIAAQTFIIGNNGAPEVSSSIENLNIVIGGARYTFRGGGLHSKEKSTAHYASDKLLLIDRDVASYYPQIILNLGLFPQHLGRAFLDVFRELVKRRLHAKREAKRFKEAGDKEQARYWQEMADSLKITINGTFGKLGNMFSIVYAPDLLFQVTLTGQLALLMLIEAIELVGIQVVSANTDGIVIKCEADRYAELDRVIMEWENATGFVTEEARYAALYSRDVNNYIAVKVEGDCKTKGCYSERGSALNSPLSKNPETLICSDAVQAYLAHNRPINETIEACRDLRRFVSVRQVKGGAKKGERYLGKVVRWYYARGETGEISYVLTGNKVPKSEGAKPCMILPAEFPDDIDYDRYINEANEMLYELGRFKKVAIGRLF